MPTTLGTVPSMSTPGVKYDIVEGDDGITYCSCPAWPKWKICKHIMAFRDAAGTATSPLTTPAEVEAALRGLDAISLRKKAKAAMGVAAIFYSAEARSPRYLKTETILERCLEKLGKMTQAQLTAAFIAIKEPTPTAAAAGVLASVTAVPGLTWSAKKKANAEKFFGSAIEGTNDYDEEAGKLKVDVVIKKEEAAKLVDYIPVENFDFMVDAAKTGDNLFFVGPSGSGKTETAKQIAKLLDAELIRQNFDGETTVDNMIGCHVITVDAGGKNITQHQDGELTKACRLAASGKKVIYLADEVPAGKAEILFKFHRVLEREKRTHVRTIEIDGSLLTIPGGMLSFIGTGNCFRMDESGAYPGNNSMNQAFCNRWSGGVYFVDYAKNEIDILVGNGIARKIAEPLVVMAKQIRAKSKDEHNPVICSTRELLDIGEKAMRWGTRKAVEIVYLSKLLQDERKMVDPIILAQSWPSK